MAVYMDDLLYGSTSDADEETVLLDPLFKDFGSNNQHPSGDITTFGLPPKDIESLLGTNFSDFLKTREELLKEGSDPTSATSKSIKKRKQKQNVVRTDQNKQSAFQDAPQFIRTGGILALVAPPLSRQHTRREKDHLKDLRYVSVGSKGGIRISVPDIRDRVPSFETAYLRITRTTIPSPPRNPSDVFVHPYPLWMNEKDVEVHHGALLMKIDNDIIHGAEIEIKHLLMEHLLNKPLEAMKQWRIYTNNQLSFSNWHSIKTGKAKHIINEFELKRCKLHFQIFLIDENKQAHATDLMCETRKITEYEGAEFEKLNLTGLRDPRKTTKRVGNASAKIIGNKPSRKARKK